MKSGVYTRVKEKGRKKDVKKGKRKRQGSPDQQIEAEHIVQACIDKGEVVVPAESEKRPVSKDDSSHKRANTERQQGGLPKKIARRQSNQHSLRDISSESIKMTSVHLGSGSYISCYLSNSFM